MKFDKKIVPIRSKPIPIKDRSQKEIMEERTRKRDEIMNKYKPKK